jgi:hypothetical protein
MHSDTTLGKQVITLNESFVNFFKGSSFGVGAIPSRTSSFIVLDLQSQ